MDLDTHDVNQALQHAYAGLLRAVELERRRPDDEVDTMGLVANIHELRIMMSAAAQMMLAFKLERYRDVVDWGADGRPKAQTAVTPGQCIMQADADLGAAYKYLEQAADSLTSARRRLTALR